MIQRYEEIPAVCKNPDCSDYQAFELIDVETVQDDSEGRGFVICPTCNQKIYVDE